MPELPEVQTTVNGLKKAVVGLTISKSWTDLAKKSVSRPDYKDTIKYLPFFKSLQEKVSGAKIVSAERRAKNILINLSGGHTILIHMKMTGHIMYGKYLYDKKQNSWAPAHDEKNEALRDPYNRFLHFVLEFTNGKHLVLADVRKFAKVTLLSTDIAHKSKHLDKLGPEPLDRSFTIKMFTDRMQKKPSGKVKSVLMDQTIISGVGNIYSDEALWLSGIHPQSIVSKIPAEKMRSLFVSTKKVLEKGINFGGDSTSDYRRVDGTRGKFSHEHNAYRLLGKKCKKKSCRGVIMRKVVGGRSAHFCEVHQKLFI
ncbi:MAG: bifunctional DNA-formamidopyrimidine glycosylase/DNA-(apurinic or apyrimidinic site) lyase [Candidatus Pacebacteria bacterium]|nr:bifunctional DNA-formamidopyrimidine glycosylase/DNA-(apurinic or apyrimidinic site) lyase [Candidatus Paceibacterota bacterium]